MALLLIDSSVKILASDLSCSSEVIFHVPLGPRFRALFKHKKQVPKIFQLKSDCRWDLVSGKGQNFGENIFLRFCVASRSAAPPTRLETRTKHGTCSIS